MRLHRSASAAALAFVVGCGAGSDTASSAGNGPENTPGGTLVPDYTGLVLPLNPIITAHPLTIPTYDSSGQAVHPDVVRFPSPWHGWEYWMAVTPYPGGDPNFENPSILVSHDGEEWSVPAGVTNPLVPPIAIGYNSDPDLTYDAAADRLILVYREVSGGNDIMKSLVSSDGVTWSAPKIVLQRPNHDMISPTVTVTATGGPALWYVDAGPPGPCTVGSTRVWMQTASSLNALQPARIEAGWSGARAVTLTQPGYSVWHLDVAWIASRNEYWAVYPAYVTGQCDGEDLFFARSADGITWKTYNVPVIHRGQLDWVQGRVYRSSVSFDAERNGIRIFFSAIGAAPDFPWTLGEVEYDVDEFLDVLDAAAAPPPTSHSRLIGRMIRASDP